MYRLSLLLSSSSPDTAILAVVLDVIISLYILTYRHGLWLYCTCVVDRYRKFTRFHGESSQSGGDQDASMNQNERMDDDER